MDQGLLPTGHMNEVPGLLVKGTCTSVMLPSLSENRPWLVPFVSVDEDYASVSLPLQSNSTLYSEKEKHLAGLFCSFSLPSSTTSQDLGNLRKEGTPRGYSC